MASGGVVRRKRRSMPTQQEIKDNPEAALARVTLEPKKGVVAHMPGAAPTIEQLFAGEGNAGIRQSLVDNGVVRTAKRELRVVSRERPDGQHEIMSIGAVSRDPGTTQALIDAIQDFIPTSGRDRKSEMDQLWTIYKQEGIVSTGVNKYAALVSGAGRYKVRRAKSGKKQKAKETLQLVLDAWVRDVNNAPIDGVVTGSRGLKALTQQAVRQALVEGDWMGRTVWTQHQVGTEGSFSLPMIIQTLSMRYIEAADTFGTGVEGFYWKPEEALVRELEKPKDKNFGDLLKKFIPKDILSQLKKDKKAWLDPALLCHVKHRGVDFEPYGESLLKPAMFAIAYKRAVESLDLVSIQSLINRLLIVTVGSDDPESPFSDPSVSAARAALMQQFFEEAGPATTIVWQGADVSVIEVGAHAAVLDLSDRHRIGDSKIKIAIGVPDALLNGTSSDSGGGKAAGWAAALAAGMGIEETRTRFEQTWTTIGERIAEENGFTDVEILFELSDGLLDRVEERNQARLDRTTGGTIKTWLSQIGLDPDAEYLQACKEKGLDPDDGSGNGATWEEAFAVPQGLAGQGAGGNAPPPGTGPGKKPGGGRTPDSTTGKPKAAPKEKKKPSENK